MLGSSVHVFRRRESALSPSGAAINDRSSFAARSVLELDVLGAVGTVLNTPSGVRRFLDDPTAREAWLGELTHAILKRDFERLMVLVLPSTSAAAKWTAAQSELSHQMLHRESAQLTGAIDPSMELVKYAVHQQLCELSRAETTTPQGPLQAIRIEGLLQAAKERALPMLLQYVFASSHFAKPLQQVRSDDVLLAHETRTDVKRSLRACRRRVVRRLLSFQRFIVRFVSAVGAAQAPVPALHDCEVPPPAVTLSHVPETFVCDSYAVPPSVKQALVSELALRAGRDAGKCDEQRELLQHWIDPSRTCQASDGSAKRNCRATTSESADSTATPSAAFGHGGQTRGSRATHCSTPRNDLSKLQWLPADALVHETGSRVSIVSEVNALHPLTHSALYGGLELLLAVFVPLFERVLTSTATPTPPAPCFQPAGRALSQRAPLAQARQAGRASRQTKRTARARTSQSTATETSSRTVGADCADAGHVSPAQSLLLSVRHSECWSTQLLHQHLPDQASIDRWTAPSVPREQQISLRGQRIQVVTRVSVVQLTPARPCFPGQTEWQVDGDSAEHLVAVGYHVLECDNISVPELAFRAFAHNCAPLRDPAACCASSACALHHEFVMFGEKIAGYYENSYGRLFLQPWGSIALLCNRSFAAPAYLAHRLEPFELLDPSYSGRLTLVKVFLVDPTHEIPSTATLAPEDHDQLWIDANVDMVCCSSLSRPAAQTGSMRPQSPPQSCCSGAAKRDAMYIPDEVARVVADFAGCSSESREGEIRRRNALEQERARRHEVRFLHPALVLERMQVTLPDLSSRCFAVPPEYLSQ